MRMSLKLKIAIIIILQTVVLCGMVAKKQWTIHTGQAILLETQPVDPRSLFRGDFVRIRYDISNIPVETIQAKEELKTKKYYYVKLEQKEKYWEAVSIHPDYPKLDSGQVAIKGFLKYSGKILNFKYGIESYFVPEGTGRKLERPENGDKVSMRIMVDKYGNAAIKDILVNDKIVYSETLF